MHQARPPACPPLPRWRRGAAVPPLRGALSLPGPAGPGGRLGGCCCRRRLRRRLSPCDESISPHCHVSRAAAAAVRASRRCAGPLRGRARPPSSFPFPFFSFTHRAAAAAPVPAPVPPRRGGGEVGLPGGRRDAPRGQQQQRQQQPSRPGEGRIGGAGRRAATAGKGTPLPADVRAAPPPALGCVSTGPGPFPRGSSDPGKLERPKRVVGSAGPGTHTRTQPPPEPPARQPRVCGAASRLSLSVCLSVCLGGASAGFVSSRW